MIRAYTPSDLDAVTDAWYAASLLAHSFLPAEFFVAERAALRDEWMPVAEAYVYGAGDDVVGFVALVGDEIGGLFVHPDHQRRGVGRALLDHVRSLRPSLEVDVFAENEIGRRFYAEYGFEHVGTSVEPTTGHTQFRLRLA
jgi:putative acetyltransferase